MVPPNDPMGRGDMGRDRDLVLPPNTFAYILDSTKGKVSVYVGPYKSSLSNTDQLVIWDAPRGRFVPVNDVERAIQVFPVAAEGQYIVLLNPADTHPSKGNTSEAVDLDTGRKVNVPGPVNFPLWPGQTAKTIDGHHLRHNQFLIVRVCEEEQARKNWKSAVVKPAPAQKPPAGNETIDTPPAAATPTSEAPPPALTMGQLMLVKGTEVSFYIPPTGIEVVMEGERFVREAVTLERLEYCILLDENGEKSYRQGPAVVFPKPTEKFVEADDGSRKFRAIELNEHSGLYIKVIAEYNEGEKVFKVGEELFITGKEQAIYFPRPEHSIIEYGTKKVHFAIEIPAGEGRYVLNRDKGTVDLVQGPKMFLPDPRTQVIVLRVLDPQAIDLMYPGNKEALQINQEYRAKSASLLPGARLESMEVARSALLSNTRVGANMASDDFVGDSFKRGTSYTPPRTIVLNNKYEGAVSVNIWPGYAVLVTKKVGERRVELGPKMVLLEYDETLMPLSLSTGRPKTDDKLFRTAYLRVENNQVGDIVEVETRDLVKINVEVSYRVNFEGKSPEEQQKWFGVENYVKILTDHARSRIRNAAKRQGVQEFNAKGIDIVRDAILGEVPTQPGAKRPGLSFTENGMRVYDVEVLDISIKDRQVAELLLDAQSEALAGAITLSKAEESVTRTTKLEEMKRQEIDEREKTATKTAEVAKSALEREIATQLADAAGQLKVKIEFLKVTDVERESAKADQEQAIELARQDAKQKIELLTGETEQLIRRTEAMDANIITALQMFGDKAFVEKLITAVAPVAVATGTTTIDVLSQFFKGTPFEKMVDSLAARPLAVVDKPARAAA